MRRSDLNASQPRLLHSLHQKGADENCGAEPVPEMAIMSMPFDPTAKVWFFRLGLETALGGGAEGIRQ
jgi:hypothetical protein